MYRKIPSQEIFILAFFLTITLTITLPLPSHLSQTTSTLVNEMSTESPKFETKNESKHFQHRSGFRHFHHHHHHRQFEGQSKDTYSILLALRKVRGPNGHSPVCKICQNRLVDAKTYDFFCLPNSESVDGEMCDALTIIGTTRAKHISVACKLVLSKAPVATCE